MCRGVLQRLVLLRRLRTVVPGSSLAEPSNGTERATSAEGGRIPRLAWVFSPPCLLHPRNPSHVLRVIRARGTPGATQIAHALAPEETLEALDGALHSLLARAKGLRNFALGQVIREETKQPRVPRGDSIPRVRSELRRLPPSGLNSPVRPGGRRRPHGQEYNNFVKKPGSWWR